MTYAMSLTSLLGLSAGVAIMLVGVFVLLARPRAMVNRAFFVLALVDGMSNLLFEMREMAVEPALKLYYMATFYYFFVAFVVALALFGLLFPRPLGDRRLRPWLLAVPVTLGVATLALFALDHGLFYSPAQVGGRLVYPRTDLGQVVDLSFPLAAGIVVLKLTHDLFTDVVAPRRRQAVLVLGGMVVAYGGIFLGYIRSGLAAPERTFLAPSPFVLAEYWLGYAGFVALLVALGVRLARTRGPALEHRRFLFGCLGGAVALAVFANVGASGFFLVQILSLLVYPLLLAYAIVSAEAFQINPQVRRATMLTLGSAGIAAVFVIAESLLDDYLGRALSFLDSGLVATILSALIAASLAVPMLRLATRLVNRVAPELAEDAQHTKNLALYRLTLEGALQDGMLDARESRALLALRDGLGISEREHQELVAQVRASLGVEISSSRM